MDTKIYITVHFESTDTFTTALIVTALWDSTSRLRFLIPSNSIGVAYSMDRDDPNIHRLSSAIWDVVRLYDGDSCMDVVTFTGVRIEESHDEINITLLGV